MSLSVAAAISLTVAGISGGLAIAAGQGTSEQALMSMKASTDLALSMGAQAYESSDVQNAVAENKDVAATIERVTGSQEAMQSAIQSAMDKIKAITQSQNSILKSILG